MPPGIDGWFSAATEGDVLTGVEQGGIPRKGDCSRRRSEPSGSPSWVVVSISEPRGVDWRKLEGYSGFRPFSGEVSLDGQSSFRATALGVTFIFGSYSTAAIAC